eukprot:3867655-Prymnesium_polylepis.1
MLKGQQVPHTLNAQVRCAWWVRLCSPASRSQRQPSRVWGARLTAPVRPRALLQLGILLERCDINGTTWATHRWQSRSWPRTGVRESGHQLHGKRRPEGHIIAGAECGSCCGLEPAACGA